MVLPMEQSTTAMRGVLVSRLLRACGVEGVFKHVAEVAFGGSLGLLRKRGCTLASSLGSCSLLDPMEESSG